MKKKLIAIVDDDIYIGNMLETVLQNNGYDTIRAYSGSEILMLVKTRKPDLILLDLMLPGVSGEQVVEKIKDIPIIVISAKIDIDSKVNLLVNGAVDYITKPFEIDELLARILVQLRNNSFSTKTTYSYGNITLNLDTHECVVLEQSIKLTKTEFEILYQLIKNKDRVLSKCDILNNLESKDIYIEDSSLKVHIGNLRNKLKKIDGIDYIESVWGIGYKIKNLTES